MDGNQRREFIVNLDREKVECCRKKLQQRFTETFGISDFQEKKIKLKTNKQTKKKDIKYIHHLLWMKNNNSMVGSHFSPQLYVTFWALSMFDLYVPSERYEQELNKLKQQQAQLDDNKDMVSFIIKPKILKS